MLGPIRECQTRVRSAKGWIVSNDFLQDLNGLIKLMICGVSLRLCVADDWRERIELTCPVGFIDRLLHAATDVGEVLGKPLMGGGVAGIKLKGPSELGLATGKIPIVFNLVGSQDRMWTRECGIELQGFLCCGIRLGGEVIGVPAAKTVQHAIG